jgi:Ca-activated chloride channel family protein
VAGAILLLAATAQAGPIFFAGYLKDGNFIADKDHPGPCYTIRYSTVSARVEGRRPQPAASRVWRAADVVTRSAHTTITETVLGAEKEIPGALCIVPLPAGAMNDGFRITIQAPDKELVHHQAEFLTAKEAQKVYEALAKGSGSVAICAYAGRPALLLRAATLLPRQEVQVTFRQEVECKADGLFEVACPLPAANLARGPVAQVTLTATIEEDQPLRAVLSPTHEVTVERDGLRKAAVRFTARDYAGGDDFRLLYVADKDPLGLRVIAHRAEGEEEGYFLLVGNPTGEDSEKVLEKDVLFVLDTSGSMRGEKIEQARSAIEYCLAHLNAGDRFNIITFGTDVKGFRDGLVKRSDAELKAARQWIEEAVANGQTNIAAALEKALSGEAAKGRPRIVIFLTDGVPTVGELVPDEILKNVPRWNVSGSRIFVVGVGNEVNAHLLDNLAEAGGGASEYVGPQEEIDVKVASLYNRLSNPVLEDVSLAFGELKANSVYPAKVPALYKGTQVLVTGRYRAGGTHTFTLSGTVAGVKREYSCQAVLPDRAQPKDDYVAVLWAGRKIGFLLQEIRLHGENKELVEEIVRLSRKFGVVTEYTQFIALAKADASVKDLAAVAARNMRDAHAQQAGQWAVNQAMNDNEFQNRAAAVNRFRDRQGRVQEAQNIAQVGRRAFYFRDGQWQDAEDAGARKTRVVKLYSDEYFDLLRKDTDFARAQSVGWNMSMNVGAERIEVKKDGKTRLPPATMPAGDMPQGGVDRMNQRIQNQLPNQAQQQIDPR